MISFDDAMAALDDAEITDLNTDALDDGDVLNLILQRSEIIRDQPRPNHYIKAWVNGNHAPIQELINTLGRDVLVRRAAAFILCEFRQLEHIFDDKAPDRIADIGCGYALFDLFLAKKYGSQLALIDLESNENRHFGFQEEGAAYSSLANASQLLTDNGVQKSAIKTYNPEKDDLSEVTNLDYAFSFISCGYHYPWTTYARFFEKNIAEEGCIILDVRGRELGNHLRQMSHMGYVRAIVKAANNSADRVLLVKSPHRI